MAKINELKWGSILSYAQIVLSVIIGIVYTPVMIRLLGRNEYGLYNTVSYTISLLSILNLGFNSSYIRYYSKYKRENDTGKIYSLNGMFLCIFIVISIIACLCGGFLTTHLELVFKDGLTADEYDTAHVLMILLTINLAISFPMSVFSTIISANERFVFLKVMGMINTVLSPLVNLPLLLLGFRSVGLVASALVFTILTDAVYIYYVIAKLNNRFLFGKAEKGLLRSLFAFTSFIAINIIVDQINNGIDRVLLGRFCGTAIVAVYAVGANLYTYYVNISLAISGVFTPRIHHIYNSLDDDNSRNKELTGLFIKVGRIQYIILMLIASGIVIFGKQFIQFWVGMEYEESYYVALLLVLPVSIPLIQNLGIEIQRAANKHKFRSVIYLFMAIINLVLSVFLCQAYGAVGAAVGTALSLIIANGFIMNWYYYKRMGIGIPDFWKSILRITVGMLPAFIIGFLMRQIINFANIWSLLFFILLYTGAYSACVWKFSMNQYEKDLLLKPLNKIVRRTRRSIE